VSNRVALAPTGAPIEQAFSGHARRAALMPYMMGGFPSLAESLRVGEAYAEVGADLIELGVPFSDPLADGPAIQAAGQRALAAGARLEDVLREVASPLSSRVPVILMCYSNPLLHRGLEASVAAIAAAGVAGLIVPDMPASEAGELRGICDSAGIALVPLVAPTTPPEQVREIAAAARGFVYVVSVTGVTGERAQLPPELSEVVGRVRSATELPVAVGFGVGTPEQAASVATVADGVIIGSRLVRAVAEAPDVDAGLTEVRGFLADVSEALKTGT
jgi:tryptophan synthase alpha chain